MTIGFYRRRLQPEPGHPRSFGEVVRWNGEELVKCRVLDRNGGLYYVEDVDTGNANWIDRHEFGGSA